MNNSFKTNQDIPKDLPEEQAGEESSSSSLKLSLYLEQKECQLKSRQARSLPTAEQAGEESCSCSFRLFHAMLGIFTIV